MAVGVCTNIGHILAQLVLMDKIDVGGMLPDPPWRQLFYSALEATLLFCLGGNPFIPPWRQPFEATLLCWGNPFMLMEATLLCCLQPTDPRNMLQFTHMCKA